MLFVGKRLIDQGEKIRVISLERLSGGNGSVAEVRRISLAGGVEISLHSGHPVFHATSSRSRAAPEALAHRCLVHFLESPIEFDVHPLDPQLVLLFAPALLKVWVYRA